MFTVVKRVLMFLFSLENFIILLAFALTIPNKIVRTWPTAAPRLLLVQLKVNKEQSNMKYGMRVAYLAGS